MTDPIIPKDMIRAKAREEFAMGHGRDDHGFNWHAECAIETWQQEWDRLHAITRPQAQIVMVSPP